MKLLNAKQLAEEMSVGATFITAMRRDGYAFEFGHQTTLAHALKWRRGNPAFRVNRVKKARLQAT